MSKAAGKSLPLMKLAAIAAASAALALFLRPSVAPLLKGQGIAAYALVFAAAFCVLCFIARRVVIKFSFKPQGLEKISGLAPRLARAFLVVFVFGAPLLFLQGGSAKSGPSLGSLIAASEKRAAAPEAGYKTDDRATLGKLMEEKP